MKRPLFLDQPGAWRSTRTLSNPANHANPFHAPSQTGYPRSWWVTVIVCGLAGLLIVLLTGCGRREESDKPDSNRRGMDQMWQIYGPDEHGVVCYREQYQGILSCVKVRP